MPISWQSVASCWRSAEDSIMTVASVSPGRAAISRASMKPSISGIMASSSTSENGSPRARAASNSRSAAGPLSASTGRRPQFRSISCRM